MLVKNLKISEIYRLSNSEMKGHGNIFCEYDFLGFAVVKQVHGIMVRDVLNKNRTYKTNEALIDEIGTEYAPSKLHDPLSKYTDKKIITKKGVQKILIQKRNGLL